jgi:hypothetical protein
MKDSKWYCIRIPLVWRNIVMSVVAGCDGNFVVRGAWAVRVTVFVIGTNTTVVISALAAKWIRTAFVWAIIERVVVIY